MSNLNNWLARVMQDVDGTPSSKRLIVLLFSIVFIIGFLASLFWNLKPPEFISNAISYIIMTGLGATGLEKFAPGRGNDQNPPQQ